MGTWKELSFWIVIGVASTAAGLLYASLVAGADPAPAAIYGLCTGLAALAFERGVILPGLQARMRQWPSLLYVPATELAYVLMILVGHTVAALIIWALRITGDSLVGLIVPSLRVFVYSFAATAVFVFVLRVRDLMGGEVFGNLLIGRYHRPVQEERIFLFLDVVGSTAYARKHGDLRAQEYLGAIFAAIAEPVRRHGGAIEDYVGDMALITWPAARGLRQAQCVACIFAIDDAIERKAADWQRRFGQIPSFHAALHGGSVVTAEVGVDRHKISYFGDVVNTTGRIEALCRSLQCPVLISADLLQKMSRLPAGIRASTRGDHILKGRDQQIPVFSLERGATLPSNVADLAAYARRTQH